MGCVDACMRVRPFLFGAGVNFSERGIYGALVRVMKQTPSIIPATNPRYREQREEERESWEKQQVWGEDSGFERA